MFVFNPRGSQHRSLLSTPTRHPIFHPSRLLLEVGAILQFLNCLALCLTFHILKFVSDISCIEICICIHTCICLPLHQIFILLIHCYFLKIIWHKICWNLIYKPNILKLEFCLLVTVNWLLKYNVQTVFSLRGSKTSRTPDRGATSMKQILLYQIIRKYPVWWPPIFSNLSWHPCFIV